MAVLSYQRYCRYRATMKRLENVQNEWMRNSLVEALGGYTASSPNMKLMFCKDTFDYPELETHDLLCNHLAPKLKGRPRGRRKKTLSESPQNDSSVKRDESPISDSNESEVSSECSIKVNFKKKNFPFEKF